MRCILHFNYARNSAYKTATFPSIEVKKDYTQAESQDPSCRAAWMAYTKAFTPEQRDTCAENLDITRYAFFKRWNAIRKKSHSAPALKPVEDT
jgi:hypothetical protein